MPCRPCCCFVRCARIGIVAVLAAVWTASSGGLFVAANSPPTATPAPTPAPVPPPATTPSTAAPVTSTDSVSTAAPPTAVTAVSFHVLFCDDVAEVGPRGVDMSAYTTLLVKGPCSANLTFTLVFDMSSAQRPVTIIFDEVVMTVAGIVLRATSIGQCAGIRDLTVIVVSSTVTTTGNSSWASHPLGSASALFDFCAICTNAGGDGRWTAIHNVTLHILDSTLVATASADPAAVASIGSVYASGGTPSVSAVTLRSWNASLQAFGGNAGASVLNVYAIDATNLTISDSQFDIQWSNVTVYRKAETTPSLCGIGLVRCDSGVFATNLSTIVADSSLHATAANYGWVGIASVLALQGNATLSNSYHWVTSSTLLVDSRPMLRANGNDQLMAAIAVNMAVVAGFCAVTAPDVFVPIVSQWAPTWVALANSTVTANQMGAIVAANVAAVVIGENCGGGNPTNVVASLKLAVESSIVLSNRTILTAVATTHAANLAAVVAVANGKAIFSVTNKSMVAVVGQSVLNSTASANYAINVGAMQGQGGISTWLVSSDSAIVFLETSLTTAETESSSGNVAVNLACYVQGAGTWTLSDRSVILFDNASSAMATSASQIAANLAAVGYSGTPTWTVSFQSQIVFRLNSSMTANASSYSASNCAIFMISMSVGAAWALTDESIIVLSDSSSATATTGGILAAVNLGAFVQAVVAPAVTQWIVTRHSAIVLQSNSSLVALAIGSHALNMAASAVQFGAVRWSVSDASIIVITGDSLLEATSLSFSGNVAAAVDSFVAVSWSIDNGSAIVVADHSTLSAQGATTMINIGAGASGPQIVNWNMRRDSIIVIVDSFIYAIAATGAANFGVVVSSGNVTINATQDSVVLVASSYVEASSATKGTYAANFGAAAQVLSRFTIDGSLGFTVMDSTINGTAGAVNFGFAISSTVNSPIVDIPGGAMVVVLCNATVLGRNALHVGITAPLAPWWHVSACNSSLPALLSSEATCSLPVGIAPTGTPQKYADPVFLRAHSPSFCWEVSGADAALASVSAIRGMGSNDWMGDVLAAVVPSMASPSPLRAVPWREPVLGDVTMTSDELISAGPIIDLSTMTSLTVTGASTARSADGVIVLDVTYVAASHAAPFSISFFQVKIHVGVVIRSLGGASGIRNLAVTVESSTIASSVTWAPHPLGPNTVSVLDFVAECFEAVGAGPVESSTSAFDSVAVRIVNSTIRAAGSSGDSASSLSLFAVALRSRAQVLTMSNVDISVANSSLSVTSMSRGLSPAVSSTSFHGIGALLNVTSLQLRIAASNVSAVRGGTGGAAYCGIATVRCDAGVAVTQFALSVVESTLSAYSAWDGWIGVGSVMSSGGSATLTASLHVVESSTLSAVGTMASAGNSVFNASVVAVLGVVAATCGPSAVNLSASWTRVVVLRVIGSSLTAFSPFDVAINCGVVAYARHTACPTANLSNGILVDGSVAVNVSIWELSARDAAAWFVYQGWQVGSFRGEVELSNSSMNATSSNAMALNLGVGMGGDAQGGTSWLVDSGAIVALYDVTLDAITQSGGYAVNLGVILNALGTAVWKVLNAASVQVRASALSTSTNSGDAANLGIVDSAKLSVVSWTVSGNASVLISNSTLHAQTMSVSSNNANNLAFAWLGNGAATWIITDGSIVIVDSGSIVEAIAGCGFATNFGVVYRGPGSTARWVISHSSVLVVTGSSRVLATASNCNFATNIGVGGFYALNNAAPSMMSWAVTGYSGIFLTAGAVINATSANFFAVNVGGWIDVQNCSSSLRMTEHGVVLIAASVVLVAESFAYSINVGLALASSTGPLDLIWSLESAIIVAANATLIADATSGDLCGNLAIIALTMPPLTIEGTVQYVVVDSNLTSPRGTAIGFAQDSNVPFNASLTVGASMVVSLCRATISATYFHVMQNLTFRSDVALWFASVCSDSATPQEFNSSFISVAVTCPGATSPLSTAAPPAVLSAATAVGMSEELRSAQCWRSVGIDAWVAPAAAAGGPTWLLWLSAPPPNTHTLLPFANTTTTTATTTTIATTTLSTLDSTAALSTAAASATTTLGSVAAETTTPWDASTASTTVLDTTIVDSSTVSTTPTPPFTSPTTARPPTAMPTTTQFVAASTVTTAASSLSSTSSVVVTDQSATKFTAPATSRAASLTSLQLPSTSIPTFNSTTALPTLTTNATAAPLLLVETAVVVAAGRTATSSSALSLLSANPTAATLVSRSMAALALLQCPLPDFPPPPVYVNPLRLAVRWGLPVGATQQGNVSAMMNNDTVDSRSSALPAYRGASLWAVLILPLASWGALCMFFVGRRLCRGAVADPVTTTLSSLVLAAATVSRNPGSGVIALTVCSSQAISNAVGGLSLAVAADAVSAFDVTMVVLALLEAAACVAVVAWLTTGPRLRALVVDVPPSAASAVPMWFQQFVSGRLKWTADGADDAFADDQHGSERWAWYLSLDFGTAALASAFATVQSANPAVCEAMLVLTVIATAAPCIAVCWMRPMASPMEQAQAVLNNVAALTTACLTISPLTARYAAYTANVSVATALSVAFVHIVVSVAERTPSLMNHVKGELLRARRHSLHTKLMRRAVDGPFEEPATLMPMVATTMHTVETPTAERPPRHGPGVDIDTCMPPIPSDESRLAVVAYGGGMRDQEAENEAVPVRQMHAVEGDWLDMLLDNPLAALDRETALTTQTAVATIDTLLPRKSASEERDQLALL